jgi:hypothetical protein
MFSAPFLVTLLDRVKAVVRRVARPAADRTRHVPVDAAGGVLSDRPISPVLRGVVQGWMRKKLRALSALMRRIDAGENLDVPVRPPAAANAGNEPGTRVATPLERRLPRGCGWMCAFGPNVRRDGAAFAEWLNEPWLKAKVLAAPERMAKLIGPILTATGERMPEWFPNVVRRVPRRRRSPLPLSEGIGGGVQPRDPAASTPRDSGASNPHPKPSVWMWRMPWLCASLDQHRSPFQPGGDEHPRAPCLFEPPEWQKGQIEKMRWKRRSAIRAVFVTISKRTGLRGGGA